MNLSECTNGLDPTSESCMILCNSRNQQGCKMDCNTRCQAPAPNGQSAQNLYDSCYNSMCTSSLGCQKLPDVLKCCTKNCKGNSACINACQLASQNQGHVSNTCHKDDIILCHARDPPATCPCWVTSPQQPSGPTPSGPTPSGPTPSGPTPSGPSPSSGPVSPTPSPASTWSQTQLANLEQNLPTNLTTEQKKCVSGLISSKYPPNSSITSSLKSDIVTATASCAGDKTQTLLSNPKFWIIASVSLVAIIIIIWALLR